MSESILKDFTLRNDEVSLLGRAKKDISVIFERRGVVCSIPQRPGASKPHVQIDSLAIKLWPRITVTRKKFTPHQQLAEAAAFARFAEKNEIPVVIHKRPMDPYTVTLYLEDFASIFQLADYAQFLSEEQDAEQPSEG